MNSFPPNLKSLKLFCFALFFLLSFQNLIIAQCDYPPGTITLNTAGGTSNTFYTTQYVLVDSLGQISQFQNTASFPNVIQGEYSAYAINYKTSDGINGLSNGQLFSGLTSDCLDISPAFGFSVGAVDATLAVSDATICNPVQGDIDLVVANAQNGVNYELQALDGRPFSPAITGIGTGSDLTLTIPQASAPTTTTSYKVVASLPGCTNTDITDQATVTVEGPLTVSTQPTATIICDLGDASFSVVANGGVGTLSYQWQESINGGSSFANITDGGIYGGATTATLNLTAATNAMNDYQYQVLISSGACNAITSSIATLTVEGTISFATQPTNSDVCENDNTSFAVSVANETGEGTITYQWQESTDGGISFNDLSDGGIYGGTTTATLALTGAVIGMNGYQYQLIANTGACSMITSSAVTLNVFNLPTAEAGVDDNVCDDFGGFDLSTLSTIPTSSFGTIQWTVDNGNGTPNDEGSFSDATAITPIYTPSTADIAAGSVTLTITVTGTNGSCSGQTASDDMILTIDICCNATAPSLSGN